MHRPTSSVLVGLICVLSLGAAGCGGDGKGSSANSPPTLSVAQVQSGDNQIGVVGTELALPLVARLLDASGEPLAGYAVNFRASSGDGSVFAGTSISDSRGLVRERWTLGTHTGVQTVEIRAVDSSGNPVVYATFHATASAAPPASLQDVSGTNGQAALQAQLLPKPVGVRVTDIYFNPVPGVVVSFTPCPVCGSVSSRLVTTNDEGIASANWTLGIPIGEQTLTASLPGLPDLPLTALALQAPPSDPVVVLVQSGDGQSTIQHERASEALRVLVADALGNGVPGVAVSFAATPGSGYVSPSTVNTNNNGFAEAYFFFHSSGQQQVQATVGAMPPAIFTISVASTPYRWDGEYTCGVSGDPANGFDMTLAQNAVQRPLPGVNRFLRDVIFDEATGALTADVRMSLNIHHEITGALSVDSQDRATGSGTYIRYYQLTATETGTWVCNRR